MSLRLKSQASAAVQSSSVSTERAALPGYARILDRLTVRYDNVEADDTMPEIVTNCLCQVLAVPTCRPHRMADAAARVLGLICLFIQCHSVPLFMPGAGSTHL